MATANWQPTKAEFWKNLPAPARPWPSEVDWFEKYALDKKAQGKKDTLILGSTVEFRSMLHKNGMNVHVVDFSKIFTIFYRANQWNTKARKYFMSKIGVPWSWANNLI